jgi:hypothetical protein
MIVSLRHFLGWLVSSFSCRVDLVLENLALRRQLLALHVQRPPPSIDCPARTVLGCANCSKVWGSVGGNDICGCTELSVETMGRDGIEVSRKDRSQISLGRKLARSPAVGEPRQGFLLATVHSWQKPASCFIVWRNVRGVSEYWSHPRK